MNSLTLPQQLLNIKKTFPTDEAFIDYPYLIIKMQIKPSEVSSKYPITIKYDDRKSVKAWVTGNLKKLDNPNFPHNHGVDKERGCVQMCLYYPKNNEWDSSRLITKTIIPWISEWLFYYELWLGSDEWYGGGIHPERGDE